MQQTTHKKHTGVYYTPQLLADGIVRLVISPQHSEINNILEPSCGNGVFVEALKKTVHDKSCITGVEINSAEADILNKKYSQDSSVSIYCADFFEFKEQDNTKYDLITGNPPYINYHHITNKQKNSMSQIFLVNGLKKNLLTNIWAGFLTACASMLSDNGKLAFIMPSEILQVSFAEEVRAFLLKIFSRIAIIAFTFPVFPDIQQNVIVFIGEKGEAAIQNIGFAEVDNINDFMSLTLDKIPQHELLQDKEKWTQYFISREARRTIADIKSDSRFVKFSDIAAVNTGVTTGNNKFFCVNKAIAEEYMLQDVSIPLIQKGSHVKGLYFTKDDWLKNYNANKINLLVNYPDIPIENLEVKLPEKTCSYIKKGEGENKNKRYKCSIRKNWYSIPSLWTADMFLERYVHSFPLLIVNKCKAINTDNIFRVKLKEGISSDDILLSFYNSITMAFVELYGRSYGGGILELVPRETDNIMLPVTTDISQEVKSHTLKTINKMFTEGHDIENILDYVDEHILLKELGIEKSLCAECRNIWHELRGRRINLKEKNAEK